MQSRHAQQFFQFLTCTLAILVLTGCSLFKSRPELPSNLSPDDRIRYLQQRNYWNLTGRIGITTKDESNSASFSWEKNNDTLVLRIYGSLGVTYARLESKPGFATIELSDDEVYQDTDAERLLWQTTGWYIPVNLMQHWILGIPEQAPSFEMNNDGYLARLNYGHWEVNYQKYQDFRGLRMPKKLRADHPDVTIKFSIHDWEFSPDE